MTTALGTPKAPAKEAPHYAANKVGEAAFTIAAQAGSVINVGVQLKDANFNAYAGIGVVDLWLSDNADGSTLTATSPSAVAIGTNGVILATLTAVKTFKVASKSDGSFDLNITKVSGTPTWYLAVRMADGTVRVSSAIVFA